MKLDDIEKAFQLLRELDGLAKNRADVMTAPALGVFADWRSLDPMDDEIPSGPVSSRQVVLDATTEKGSVADLRAIVLGWHERRIDEIGRELRDLGVEGV